MDQEHQGGTSWSGCSNCASSSSNVASPSSSFTTAEVEDPDIRVDEDCVRLTEEQYNCITTLARDIRFQGPWTAKASPPTWQEMMRGGKREISWYLHVHSGWLGGLKFGLISEAVEGGSTLYDHIFSIYERLIEVPGCSLGLVKLCFCHIGRGWFRIQLGTDKPAITRQRRKQKQSEETLSRKFQQLSSQALHMRRTQKPQVSAAGSRRGSRSSGIVERLPSNEIGNGDDEVTWLDGHLSLGFCDELKRTITYIGRQLEEGGENVSWKRLDDDLKEKGSGNILHAMSDDLDSHIRKHFLVTGNSPEDSSTFDSESSTE